MSKECSVKGCSKAAVARGYCQSHYNRWYAHGDPTVELVYIRNNMIKTHPREYRSWQSMNTRCTNPNRSNYKHYGERGVKICKRWSERPNGFRNFLEDMGPRPEGCSLDRIDANGDYCPENCRWADKYTQSLNRRNSKTPYISFDKRTGRYYLRIYRSNCHYTGAYQLLEDAIKARDEILYKRNEKNIISVIEEDSRKC